MTTTPPDFPADFQLLLRLRDLAPGDPGFPGPRAHGRLAMLHHLALGNDEFTVARRLRVTRQAVNHQGRRFLRSKALRRISEQPNLYAPGPQFAVAVAAQGRDHGGWSARRRGPAPVCRIHNLQLTARVLHRAANRPLPVAPIKTWQAARGRSRHALYEMVLGGGRKARWLHAQGPRSQAVTVHLEDAFVNAAGLADAPTRLDAEAGQVLATLEGRHGFTFAAARWSGKAEFAFPAPGMEGAVGMGNGDGHWDNSLGPTEVETRRFFLALAEARRREAALFEPTRDERGLTEAILLTKPKVTVTPA